MGAAPGWESGHLDSDLCLISEAGWGAGWVSEEAGSEMVGICRRPVRGVSRTDTCGWEET